MKLWRNIRNVINNRKDIPYFHNNTVANRAINKAANKIPLGTGYESLVLLDNSTLEIYGPYSDGKSTAVKFPSEIRSLLKKNIQGKYYTVIHNHPSGRAFSLQDMLIFLRYKHLILSIVIGEDHKNGLIRYYVILKTGADPWFIDNLVERVEEECTNDNSIRRQSYRFLLDKFNVTFEDLGLEIEAFTREV